MTPWRSSANDFINVLGQNDISEDNMNCFSHSKYYDSYIYTRNYKQLQLLEQSVECPLNHSAQILVQTAQCRFLYRFTPLIISLPVRSAPFLPSRSPCLPSISHPYYFFALPPTPLSPQFLSDSSIPSLSTSIDYCLTNQILPISPTPDSFSLPPSPPPHFLPNSSVSRSHIQQIMP